MPSRSAPVSRKRAHGPDHDGPSTSDNVKVIIRIRPQNSREVEGNFRVVVEAVDENVLVFDPRENVVNNFSSRRRPRDIRKRPNKDLKFAFDRVFGPEAGNEEVYNETTNSVLTSLLDGYNCSVFAYGATGAGKTHTMLGNPTQPGVIYYAMMDLYTRIDSMKDNTTCDVAVSYLEVYNETIRDLLLPGSALPVREDPTSGVMVPGLSLHKPKSAEELLYMLQFGNEHRTQHPTDANAESSRSHAVFQVFIRQRDRTANISAEVRVAKLCLVDLAGSERATVTKNRGSRFREGANINRSLLALGNVINALADNKRRGFIPYRDSKLTRLLKDSLGGNCQTVMIAAVSPSAMTYEDTYNTLRYADRAKHIKATLKQNVVNVDFHVAKYGKIVEDLRKEILELKGKLKVLEDKPAVSCSMEITSYDRYEAEMDRVFSRHQDLCTEQLDQEVSLRTAQWKMYRKERCLARLNALSDPCNAETVTAVEGILNGLRQQAACLNISSESSRSKIEDSHKHLGDLAQQWKSEQGDSHLPKVVSMGLEVHRLRTKLQGTERHLTYTQQVVKQQERELVHNERLLHQVLKLLKRQQDLISGRGLLTPDLQQDYVQVNQQVQGQEVCWSDQSGGTMYTRGYSLADMLSLPSLCLEPVKDDTNAVPKSFNTSTNSLTGTSSQPIIKPVSLTTEGTSLAKRITPTDRNVPERGEDSLSPPKPKRIKMGTSQPPGRAHPVQKHGHPPHRSSRARHRSVTDIKPGGWLQGQTVAAQYKSNQTVSAQNKSNQTVSAQNKSAGNVSAQNVFSNNRYASSKHERDTSHKQSTAVNVEHTGSSVAVDDDSIVAVGKSMASNGNCDRVAMDGGNSTELADSSVTALGGDVKDVDDNSEQDFHPGQTTGRFPKLNDTITKSKKFSNLCTQSDKDRSKLDFLGMSGLSRLDETFTLDGTFTIDPSRNSLPPASIPSIDGTQSGSNQSRPLHGKQLQLVTASAGYDVTDCVQSDRSAGSSSGEDRLIGASARDLSRKIDTIKESVNFSSTDVEPRRDTHTSVSDVQFNSQLRPFSSQHAFNKQAGSKGNSLSLQHNTYKLTDSQQTGAISRNLSDDNENQSRSSVQTGVSDYDPQNDSGTSTIVNQSVESQISAVSTLVGNLSQDLSGCDMDQTAICDKTMKTNISQPEGDIPTERCQKLGKTPMVVTEFQRDGRLNTAEADTISESNKAVNLHQGSVLLGVGATVTKTNPLLIRGNLAVENQSLSVVDVTVTKTDPVVVKGSNSAAENHPQLSVATPDVRNGKVVRSISFEDIENVSPANKGMSYADVVRTPTPDRKPLKPLSGSPVTPMPSSGEYTGSSSNPCSANTSNDSGHDDHMAPARLFTNKPAKGKHRTLSLGEKSIEGNKSFGKKSMSTTPGYMQTTVAHNHRKKHNASRTNAGDSSEGEITDSNQSKSKSSFLAKNSAAFRLGKRSKSVSSLSRSAWQF